MLTVLLIVQSNCALLCEVQIHVKEECLAVSITGQK